MSEQARMFAEIEPGRKGEILDAALGVFDDKGYDAGSMREIASRVGVSEPALYRHFSGKEEIFLTLLRFGAGRLQRESLDALAQVRPETLRPQLLQALHDRRRAFALYAPLLRTVLPTAARNPRFLDELRQTIIAPIRVALTDKAAEIDAALGVVDAQETRDARVRALMALFVGFTVSSFVIGDAPDEATVDAALRVMGWDRSGSV